MQFSISYGDIFAYPTIKQLSSKSKLSKKTTDISGYDYSKINQLLAKNDFPVCSTFNRLTPGNILLTGVTGFVGIHILEKLLLNTNSIIYCLVRNKNNINYFDRIKKIMHFYFGDIYDDFIGSRIQIIEGDVTKHNLGLSDNNYKALGNIISCVINSAAIVKHYGKSETFSETNIDGVKKIVNFCIDFNIKLYHISTLSVS